MRLLNGVKQFFYKVDFFYESGMLRYKQESQYKTLFGGVVSLSIILLITIAFYNKVISTINQLNISSAQVGTNIRNPTSYKITPGNQLMMSITVVDVDLNNGPRYFDITMLELETRFGRFNQTIYTQHPLQACDKSHWENFPEILEDVQKLGMQTWLCMPLNTSLEIRGKISSQIYKYVQISVGKCTNQSNPQRICASQTQIDELFLRDGGNLIFSLVYINAIINPDDQNFITYYLQDKNYIYFSKQIGSFQTLFFQEYQISTDRSIIPIQNINIKKGGRIQENSIKNFYFNTDQRRYSTFQLAKSGRFTKYKRSYDKIDETLAYLGGLFGTIAIFLMVVNTYNSHSFEMEVGASLFKSQKQQINKYLKTYNFLSFLSHMLYGICQSLGCKPNWVKVNEYIGCKQQVQSQLDIKFLIERVIFLERSLQFVLKDYQIKGIHLFDKLTLKEAEEMRQKYKLKGKIYNKMKKTKKTSSIQLKNVNQINHQKQIQDNGMNEQNDRDNTISVVIDKTHLFQNNINNQNNLQDQSQDSHQYGQNAQDLVIDKQLIALRHSAQVNNDFVSMKIWEKVQTSIKLQVKKKKRSHIKLEQPQNKFFEESNQQQSLQQIDMEVYQSIRTNKIQNSYLSSDLGIQKGRFSFNKNHKIQNNQQFDPKVINVRNFENM